MRLCCSVVLWLLVQTLPHPSESFIPSAHCFHAASISPLMSSNSQQNSNSNKSIRLYPFAEARKIARGHGFESKQEFLHYECPGAYQLPKNPDQVWSEEWAGWEDFLGVPLSFEQGRKVARTLQLRSEEEYLALMESKAIDDSEIASRLPYRPDLRYKQEWQGWDDWLLGK